MRVSPRKRSRSRLACCLLALLSVARPCGAQHSLPAAREFSAEPLVHLTFSPDGRLIALGSRSYGHNVFLLTSDGELLVAGRSRSSKPAPFIHRDGKKVATLGDKGLFEVFEPSRVHQVSGVPGVSAAFSQGFLPDTPFRWDEYTVTRYDRDGKELWHYDDWHHSKTILDFQHRRTIRAFAASPNAKYAALSLWSTYRFRRQDVIGEGSASTMLLDGNTGKILWDLPGLVGLKCVLNDGKTVLATGSKLSVLDVKGANCLQHDARSDVSEVFGTADCRRLILALRDDGRELVRCLDISGDAVEPGQWEASIAGITGVVGSDDGQGVAISSLDGRVRFFRTDGKLDRVFEADAPCCIATMPGTTDYCVATNSSIYRVAKDGVAKWHVPIRNHVASKEPARLTQAVFRLKSPPAGDAPSSVKRPDIRDLENYAVTSRPKAGLVPDNDAGGQAANSLALWVFSPGYYADVMGQRTPQQSSKFLKPSRDPHVLVDGQRGGLKEPLKSNLWWVEIAFSKPRTVENITIHEDPQFAKDVAREGFISVLPEGSDEWRKVAAFRGNQSLSHWHSFERVKATKLRYHVIRGGGACSEIEVYGPEAIDELDEATEEE